jgi:hypothetical protein
LSKRRGQSEDSIYWDESKGRYIGAVSLGFSPAGTRIRKKVSGRTKTEVPDLRKGVDRERADLRLFHGHYAAKLLNNW